MEYKERQLLWGTVFNVCGLKCDEVLVGAGGGDRIGRIAK